MEQRGPLSSSVLDTKWGLWCDVIRVKTALEH
jgi:hypothetical protein